MSAAPRVLVVDGQQFLRRGLIMLSGTVDGIDVVAQAVHGDEALVMLRVKRIDVALTNAKMPVMDDIELVWQCTRSRPGLSVLVLTTFGRPDIVRRVTAVGAVGFLLKDAFIGSLAETVRTMVGGGLVIDPRVVCLAFTTDGSWTTEDESPMLAVLTPTERKVTSLVAEGLTNQAIAARVAPVEDTVKNHVFTLLHELQAPDRTVFALTLYGVFQS